ncbi:MAG: tetratricopeptide repeat protein [Moorea sp. SIO3C2]|nr:tetratricopeptide repeat protein [Moorena sp. SIO3C2]
MDQGQALYDAGRYAEAIASWQESFTLAKRQDDIDGQAIAHNYLAIGYQALSQWHDAQQSIDRGFNLLASPNEPNHYFLYAQLLTTQGNGQLQTGQTEAALASWQQAETLYQTVDATEQLTKVRINQTQALRTLGFYRQAKDTLEEINHQLGALPDSLIKLRVSQNLGQTLYRVGDLAQAKTVLTEGVELAQRLDLPQEIASLQLYLAQTTAALGEPDQALSLYQQVQQSEESSLALNANLYKLSLETKQQDPEWSQITSDLSSLYS